MDREDLAFKVLVNDVYGNVLKMSILSKVELEKYIKRKVLVSIVADKHFTQYRYNTVLRRVEELQRDGLLKYVYVGKEGTKLLTVSPAGKDVMDEIKRMGKFW